MSKFETNGDGQKEETQNYVHCEIPSQNEPMNPLLVTSLYRKGRE